MAIDKIKHTQNKFGKLRPGTPITVQAYKSDGVLYRQWDNFIVKTVKQNCLFLYGNNVVVKEKNGTIWKYYDNVIWVFFNDMFYNCIYFKNINSGYEWYCNIASPYYYENKVIKYIDYDLDVKINSDESIKVRDLDDFDLNKITFNYSAKLCKIINESKDEIVRLATNKEFIFDENFIKCYFSNNIFYEELNNMNLTSLEKLADTIIKQCHREAIIFLEGELGAGKTAFAKFIGKSLHIKQSITSPTFNIANDYVFSEGKVFSHIDLYRLKNGLNKNDWTMVLDIINNSQVAIIEWPNENLINKFNKYIKLKIKYNENDHNLRDIVLEVNNVRLDLKNFHSAKKNIK